jgi:hypothetical protein
MSPALKIALLNAQIHIRAVLLLLLSNAAIGLSGGIMHRLMAAGCHIRDGDQRDECHNERQQNEEPRDIGVAVFAQGAENPRPKDNPQGFDEKHYGGICAAAFHAANAQLVGISDILQHYHDEPEYGDD